MVTITDVYKVRAGDVVTVKIVNQPSPHTLEGQEVTFTAEGPATYLGQGVGMFVGRDGYEYPMGGYEPFLFVKAERAVTA